MYFLLGLAQPALMTYFVHFFSLELGTLLWFFVFII